MHKRSGVAAPRPTHVITDPQQPGHPLEPLRPAAHQIHPFDLLWHVGMGWRALGMVNPATCMKPHAHPISALPRLAMFLLSLRSALDIRRCGVSVGLRVSSPSQPLLHAVGACCACRLASYSGIPRPSTPRALDDHALIRLSGWSFCGDPQAAD